MFQDLFSTMYNIFRDSLSSPLLPPWGEIVETFSLRRRFSTLSFIFGLEMPKFGEPALGLRPIDPINLGDEFMGPINLGDKFVGPPKTAMVASRLQWDKVTVSSSV